MKPGVERSGTPGGRPKDRNSPRSGDSLDESKPAARYAGYRFFESHAPGVSLRSTPGFTPSPAVAG
ncbi:MAG TPA: hypothetical protein VEW46_03290 [Pyrinomonadaceae bacterium]|nr:hypothetical protein [Pyrinomonadaceae bacterium]